MDDWERTNIDDRNAAARDAAFQAMVALIDQGIRVSPPGAERLAIQIANSVCETASQGSEAVLLELNRHSALMNFLLDKGLDHDENKAYYVLACGITESYRSIYNTIAETPDRSLQSVSSERERE